MTQTLDQKMTVVIREMAGRVRDAEASDGELLARYARERDDTAFTTLVRRHAAMVLGVARRVLAHEQDAEDVCQATFILLACKASRGLRGESVGGWLCATARLTALNARKAKARRARAETRAATLATGGEDWTPLERMSGAEFVAALDEELGRLPYRYRDPLVLCYLEGLTRDAAARRLEIPVGTLRSQLERGRERLRKALHKRGIELGVALVAVTVASATRAATPQLVQSILAAVGGTTSRAVAAITQGGVTVMTKTNLTLFATFAAFAALTMGLAMVGAGAGAKPVRPEARRGLAEGKAPAALPANRPPDQEAGAGPAARVDRYGDPLPAGAVARFGTVRMRHEAAVMNAVFTADSKTIITVDGGVFTKPAVVFWDVASGREVRRLMGHRAVVYAVAVSPDGRTLASGSYPDDLRLWDLKSGKVIRVLPGHKHERVPVVQEFVFSPDGKTLASRGYQTICLWEVATGKMLQNIAASTFEGFTMAFSPDSKLLVWGGRFDPATHVWDVAAGKEVRQLIAPAQQSFEKDVFSVAFCPDGKTLAVGGFAVRFWDFRAGKLRHTSYPAGGVVRLAYLPDGKSLVLLNHRRMSVIDATTGKQVRQFQRGLRTMANLVVSPDGKTVATSWGGSRTFDLWDPATGKLRHDFQGHAHREPVLCLAVTADGKALFSGGGVTDFATLVWETATGRGLRRFEDTTQKDPRTQIPPATAALALAPDGKTLATGAKDAVVLRDPTTGKALRYLHGPREEVRWVAFSADGKILAACAYQDPEKAVWVWEAATGKVKRTIKAGQDHPCITALSPDGKRLALGGYTDGTFRIVQVSSGEELHRSAKRPGLIVGLAFAPDGRTLAACSSDGSVILWDTASATVVRSFDVQQGPYRQSSFSGPSEPLAFSKDGRTLATGAWDNTVRLWEVLTGKERARYKGHRGRVVAIAFAPGGSVVFSGSEDTTILAWDVTGHAAKPAQRTAPLDR